MSNFKLKGKFLLGFGDDLQRAVFDKKNIVLDLKHTAHFNYTKLFLRFLKRKIEVEVIELPVSQISVQAWHSSCTHLIVVSFAAEG